MRFVSVSYTHLDVYKRQDVDDDELSDEEDSDETERASTSWGTATFALGCAFKCSLNSSLKNKYI